jgi:hypothetical protein
MTAGANLESASRDGWQWSADPRFAWILKNVFGRIDETDDEWKKIVDAADTVKRAPWLDLPSRHIENNFAALESGLEHDDYRFRRAAYVRTGVGVAHAHADVQSQPAGHHVDRGVLRRVAQVLRIDDRAARRLPEPDYPSSHAIRKVRSNGEIKLGGNLVHISSALAAEPVAIEQIEQGWRVWFYKEPIGLIDRHGKKLSAIQPG